MTFGSAGDNVEETSSDRHCFIPRPSFVTSTSDLAEPGSPCLLTEWVSNLKLKGLHDLYPDLPKKYTWEEKINLFIMSLTVAQLISQNRSFTSVTHTKYKFLDVPLVFSKKEGEGEIREHPATNYTFPKLKSLLVRASLFLWWNSWYYQEWIWSDYIFYTFNITIHPLQMVHVPHTVKYFASNNKLRESREKKADGPCVLSCREGKGKPIISVNTKRSIRLFGW